MIGDSADMCSFRVRVDVDPVSWMDEVLARLTGRQSYEIWVDAFGPRLEHRNEDHLMAQARRPVVLTHICGGTNV